MPLLAPEAYADDFEEYASSEAGTATPTEEDDERGSDGPAGGFGWQAGHAEEEEVVEVDQRPAWMMELEAEETVARVKMALR